MRKQFDKHLEGHPCPFLSRKPQQRIVALDWLTKNVTVGETGLSEGKQLIVPDANESIEYESGCDISEELMPGYVPCRMDGPNRGMYKMTDAIPMPGAISIMVADLRSIGQSANGTIENRAWQDVHNITMAVSGESKVGMVHFDDIGRGHETEHGTVVRITTQQWENGEIEVKNSRRMFKAAVLKNSVSGTSPYADMHLFLPEDKPTVTFTAGQQMYYKLVQERCRRVYGVDVEAIEAKYNLPSMFNFE